MDADRIHALVCSLRVAASRRATLGRALRAGLVVVLSRFGIENAAARRGKKKKRFRQQRLLQTMPGLRG